jgi:hypothetical protein
MKILIAKMEINFSFHTRVTLSDKIYSRYSNIFQGGVWSAILLVLLWHFYGLQIIRIKSDYSIVSFKKNHKAQNTQISSIQIMINFLRLHENNIIKFPYKSHLNISRKCWKWCRINLSPENFQWTIKKEN